MWVKVYSPNVTAIEVVKRAEKRARRAKLYYMRYVVVAPAPTTSLSMLELRWMWLDHELTRVGNTGNQNTTRVAWRGRSTPT